MELNAELREQIRLLVREEIERWWQEKEEQGLVDYLIDEWRNDG